MSQIQLPDVDAPVVVLRHAVGSITPGVSTLHDHDPSLRQDDEALRDRKEDLLAGLLGTDPVNAQGAHAAELQRDAHTRWDGIDWLHSRSRVTLFLMDEELMARLRAADPKERIAAIEAIGKGEIDPDGLACLIDRLRDSDSLVRLRARMILKQVTRRDYGANVDEWQRWWKENSWIQCNRCQKRLFDHRLYYKCHARLTSEPREVVITEEDLAKDQRAEIQKLCDQMANRDPQEVEEEVYVDLQFYLCTACKREFVKEVRKGPSMLPDP